MAVHRGPGVRRDAQPVDLDHTPGRLLRRLGGRRRRRARRRPPPAPTAPARSGSRPPGRTSSASSRSAAASRPGPIRSAFNGLTCIGPLARTVDDAALLLDVLAGNRRERPAPAAGPAGAVRRGRRAASPGRLRIALSLQDPLQRRAGAARPRRSRDAGRAPRRRARRPRPRGRARPIRPTASSALSFMPRSTGGRPRLGRQRVPDHALLDPRTRGTTRARPRPAARCCALARALERPLRALRRPDLPPLRRRADADDRAAAAADRRDRRPRRLGDRQADGRRLPLRVAVERARLARRQRARPASPTTACRSARSCSARPTARVACWRSPRTGARGALGTRPPFVAAAGRASPRTHGREAGGNRRVALLRALAFRPISSTIEEARRACASR